MKKKRSVPRKKRSSFQNLYDCIRQPNTKVVLSLGGGGVRMAAHLAVMEFLERLGATPYIREVWGVSGGAFVGLPYACGMKSDQIEQILHSIFIKNRADVSLKPSVLSIVKGIFKESLFSSEEAKDISGLHDYEAIYRAGRKVLEGHQPKIPFYCLAYNLESQQTDILTPEKTPKGYYDGWMYHMDPVDAVAASTAVPIIFKPKRVSKSQLYVDGGTNEEVPTVSIYKKWKRDLELGLERKKDLLVIGINLNPHFAALGNFGHKLLRKIPAIQYIRMTMYYADLMRQAKIKDQRRLLMNDPRVEFWNIDLNFDGGLLDVDVIPQILAEARKSVPKQFARINDSLLSY